MNGRKVVGAPTYNCDAALSSPNHPNLRCRTATSKPGLAILLVVASIATADEAKSHNEKSTPWLDMNYGPFLSATIEAPQPADNITYKGVMVRLGGESKNAHPSADSRAALFDTDLLRYAAVWKGGPLRMTNVLWDTSHKTHGQVEGELSVANPVAPGWAHPERPDDFGDPRETQYGPIPPAWGRYKGLYIWEDEILFAYTIGSTAILERPSIEKYLGGESFSRTIQIDSHGETLAVHVCEQAHQSTRVQNSEGELATTDDSASNTVVLLKDPQSPESEVWIVAGSGIPAAARWRLSDAAVRLVLPPSTVPSRFRLSVWRGPAEKLKQATTDGLYAPTDDLNARTKGGPRRWLPTLTTDTTPGTEDTALVYDTLNVPVSNPWKSRLRLSGVDFFTDGKRAALSTWDGDVWIVSGFGRDFGQLRWQRVATGLFQPLGLRILDNTVYVSGRDQITRLHDLNGDGEMDFYENFNNDHQVTEHFHEFALDLQTDEAGNFYYARAGRHALNSVVPHHGTLLKVSADGLHTERVAYGFRAPNGVHLNGDGSFILTDQEGHWVPANRIDWVKPGGYHGYHWAYHIGEPPKTFELPLCWVPKHFDRSPSVVLRLSSPRWGPLSDQLICLSYGTGAIHHLLWEEVDGVHQGGLVQLPAPQTPTGLMRARVHPTTGDLYLCGLFGWASSRTHPGDFYRLRYTGKPLHIPVALHATDHGLLIRFSDELEQKRAARPGGYALERWNYRRTAEYGSKDYRVSDGKIGRDKVTVDGVKVSADGRSVFLEVADMKPCMQMRIRYRLRTAGGARLAGEIVNTVHVLRKAAPLLKDAGFQTAGQ